MMRVPFSHQRMVGSSAMIMVSNSISPSCNLFGEGAGPVLTANVLPGIMCPVGPSARTMDTFWGAIMMYRVDGD